MPLIVTARAIFNDASPGLICSRNHSLSCAGERNGCAVIGTPASPLSFLLPVATIRSQSASSAVPKLRQDCVQLLLSQLSLWKIRWRVNRVGCFTFAKQRSQFGETRFRQSLYSLTRVDVFAVSPIESQLALRHARDDIQQVRAFSSEDRKSVV